jgi:hypothetical protein
MINKQNLLVFSYLIVHVLIKDNHSEKQNNMFSNVDDFFQEETDEY